MNIQKHWPLVNSEELEKELLNEIVMFHGDTSVEIIGISSEPKHGVRIEVGKYSGFNAVGSLPPETPHLVEHMRARNWSPRGITCIPTCFERQASTSLTTLGQTLFIYPTATEEYVNLTLKSLKLFYKDELCGFEEEKLRVVDEFEGGHPPLPLRVVLHYFGNSVSISVDEVKRISVEDVRKFNELERRFKGYIKCIGSPGVVEEVLEFMRGILEAYGIGNECSKLHICTPKKNVVDVSTLGKEAPRDSVLFIGVSDELISKQLLILLQGQQTMISKTYSSPAMKVFEYDGKNCIVGVYVPGDERNWKKYLNLSFIDASDKAWKRGKIALLLHLLSSGDFSKDPMDEVEEIKSITYDWKGVQSYIIQQLKSGNYVFVKSKNVKADPIPSIF